MATDQAADPTTDDIAAPMLTLDRRDGSATIDLYRAALGPVHADYYLKAFTRFDAAGKPGASWNWTAALLTVNWLLFRQLWLPGLSYVGAMTAAVVLLFGIGPLVFPLQPVGQWALGAVAVLLAIALPGARANAWLYAACNKKMEAALAASASLEDACALLARSASARKHLMRLGAGNLALFGVAAAIVLAWPDTGALPLQTPAMQEARMAGPEPAVPLAANAEAPSPGRTSQGPVQEAPPVALTAAPEPTPTPSPITAPAPAPAPAPASAFTSAKATAASTASVASEPVVAPEPTAVAKAEKPASAVPPSAPQKKQPSKQQAKDRARELAKEKSSPASSDTYLINVGLFADPNNARNAYTKLKDAGLPATSQALKSANGQLRTRVRVGPFESQAEADRAAEKIRALRLEAAVFKP